jgi:hypothetical protein
LGILDALGACTGGEDHRFSQKVHILDLYGGVSEIEPRLFLPSPLADEDKGGMFLLDPIG